MPLQKRTPRHLPRDSSNDVAKAQLFQPTILSNGLFVPIVHPNAYFPSFNISEYKLWGNIFSGGRHALPEHNFFHNAFCISFRSL